MWYFWDRKQFPRIFIFSNFTCAFNAPERLRAKTSIFHHYYHSKQDIIQESNMSMLSRTLSSWNQSLRCGGKWLWKLGAQMKCRASIFQLSCHASARGKRGRLDTWILMSLCRMINENMPFYSKGVWKTQSVELIWGNAAIYSYRYILRLGASYSY